MLRKLRFISSICIMYIMTIGTIVVTTQSPRFLGNVVQAEPPIVDLYHVIKKPVVVSGEPTHITIDSTAIDLPIINGYYDASNDSWTLSKTEAQYAVISSLANDQQGTTFIYGHGTDAVFGEIGEHHPALGTVAHIATNSGHTFTYKLVDIHDYTPNDTSALNNLHSGSPRLIIQTCSGALSQWRTMFVFDYESVT
jgi:LPXTG-site transpeptidase (sortase) family protein